MLNNSDRILLNLAAMMADAARDVPAVNPSLTGPARVAAQRARNRDLDAAGGWLPTPRIASERTRQRIVRSLIDAGLIEQRGHGRSRQLRLTDAGLVRAGEIREACDAK